MRANCEECGAVRRLSDLIAIPNGNLTMKVVCRDHLKGDEEE